MHQFKRFWLDFRTCRRVCVDMPKTFLNTGWANSGKTQRGSPVSIDAMSIVRRTSGAFAPAILACGLLAAATGAAHADFRVCNATQNLVGVAIGYRTTSGWVTEGWWHVQPSTCKTMIEGALASRYYYLYAEDAERGGRWDGPINMCVAEKEFKIAHINDCFARGFQRVGFAEYDTGEQASWMVQLTDEPAPQTGAAVTGSPSQ
jgi:uncharacterized membrane protein